MRLHRPEVVVTTLRHQLPSRLFLPRPTLLTALHPTLMADRLIAIHLHIRPSLLLRPHPATVLHPETIMVPHLEVIVMKRPLLPVTDLPRQALMEHRLLPTMVHLLPATTVVLLPGTITDHRPLEIATLVLLPEAAMDRHREAATGVLLLEATMDHRHREIATVVLLPEAAMVVRLPEDHTDLALLPLRNRPPTKPRLLRMPSNLLLLLRYLLLLLIC